MKNVKIHVESPTDIYNGNIEVDVTLPSGGSYWATFITLENIRHLFEKNARTGEHAGGTYFPVAANMIIVKSLTSETIHRTVEHLLECGEFEEMFERLAPPEQEDTSETS